jgi:hypothetical protein
VRFRIDLVDLHDDLVLGLRDTSAQVLLGEGDPVGGIGLIAGWISTGSHDGDSSGPARPWDP